MGEAPLVGVGIAKPAKEACDVGVAAGPTKDGMAAHVQDHPGFADRYWRALREYSARDLPEEFSDDPGFFLTPSVLIAAVLVIGLHFLQAWTVRHGIFVGILGLLPSVVVAFLSLVLLAWLYWQVRLDSRRVEPYVWALLVSALAIGVCTEAFSGFVTILWRHGALTPNPSGHPNLWASEQYFAWHLLDSVPFLSVPTTLRWTEPTVFADRLTGVLLLSYTILLIVPLVRIGFAGYQFVADTWLGHRDRDSAEERRRHPTLRLPWTAPSPATLPAQALGIFTGAVLAYLVLVFVSAPTAFVGRWLNPWIGHGVTVFSHTISLSWARTAPQWAGLVVVLWILSRAVEEVDLNPVLDDPSPARLGASAAMFVSLLALVTIAFAAMSIVLLRLGWGVSSPRIPQGDEIPAAVSFYTWHALDAVPALNVTRAVHWQVHYDLTDHWSAGLLLAYKAGFFGVLIIPLALGLRALYRRHAPIDAPAIGAAAAFAETLHSCLTELDRAEKEIQRSSPTNQSGEAALAAAGDHMDNLDQGMQGIARLFGPGEAVDRANAALQAAHKWSRMLWEQHWTIRNSATPPARVDLARLRGRVSEQTDGEEVETARRAARTAERAYIAAVNAALRRAAAR